MSGKENCPACEVLERVEGTHRIYVCTGRAGCARYVTPAGAPVLRPATDEDVARAEAEAGVDWSEANSYLKRNEAALTDLLGKVDDLMIEGAARGTAPVVSHDTPVGDTQPAAGTGEELRVPWQASLRDQTRRCVGPPSCKGPPGDLDNGMCPDCRPAAGTEGGADDPVLKAILRRGFEASGIAQAVAETRVEEAIADEFGRDPRRMAIAIRELRAEVERLTRLLAQSEEAHFSKDAASVAALTDRRARDIAVATAALEDAAAVGSEWHVTAAKLLRAGGGRDDRIERHFSYAGTIRRRIRALDPAAIVDAMEGGR
jgi:hypothetical protein